MMSTHKQDCVTTLLTFKCDLNPRNPDTWSYARPSGDDSFVQWKVYEPKTEVAADGAKQPSQILEEDFTERVKTLKQVQGNDANLTQLMEAGDLFSLFDGGNGGTGHLGPIKVTELNHFVTAETTQPIETLVTQVAGHVMVEIQGLPSGIPCWFYSNPGSSVPKIVMDQFAIFWPDLVLDADDNEVLSWKAKEEIADLLASYRVKRTTRIDGYELIENGQACLYRLKVKAEFSSYHRGTVCNCIPMPGKRHDLPPGLDEPVAVRSPEIVITSPVIQEAIKDLDRVWRDRFASSVLVTGPPGCGKENMAKSLVYGSGRPGKDLQTLSLAQGDTPEHERRLFGRRSADGGQEQGLVERAENSALFLDEAHHRIKGEGIRASLLRALESKEYFPQDSNELKKIQDVLWIFASSWPLQGGERALSRLKPEDYWTRMSHVVDVGHPLDLKLLAAHEDRATATLGDEAREDVFKLQQRIIKDFFKFFWWERLHFFFDIDPVVLFPDTEESSSGDISPVDGLKHTHMLMLLPSAGNDNASDDLALLAKKFAEELQTLVGADRLSTVSIRGIRSMTSQIFSHCVGRALSGEPNVLWPGGANEQARRLRDEIRPAVQDVLQIAQIGSRSHER